jgi:PadR family transcriptional regulator, regulatory protein AphA
MSRLSATARVILGLLRLGPRTGYEIKQLTDRSTSFFWGASYGQIYPELRRLARQGFATVSDEPRGAVRRRVYRITEAGERAVSEWLATPAEDFELRDEGLLKLFFGAALEDGELVELVGRRRRWYEDSAALFREIGQQYGEIDDPGGNVLRYGIDLMDWNARWWSELERDLRREARAPASRKRESRGRRR